MIPESINSTIKNVDFLTTRCASVQCQCLYRNVTVAQLNDHRVRTVAVPQRNCIGFRITCDCGTVAVRYGYSTVRLQYGTVAVRYGCGTVRLRYGMAALRTRSCK